MGSVTLVLPVFVIMGGMALPAMSLLPVNNLYDIIY